MNLRKIFFVALLSLSLETCFAQEGLVFYRHIEWLPKQFIKIGDEKTIPYLFCKDAQLTPDLTPLVVLEEKNFEGRNPKLNIKKESFEQVDLNELAEKAIRSLKSEIEYNLQIAYEDGLPVVSVGFVPLILKDGKVFRLVDVDLEITAEKVQKSYASEAAASWSSSSVLATGNWVKIGVLNTGIYKLDFNYLKSIGLNPSDIDPRNIHLFGNGGGELPLKNSSFRYDDLAENAIYVKGEGDGYFDIDDYVLFYAKGQTRWAYDAGSGRYYHYKNYYSDTTFFFLSVSALPGKRIGNKASLGASPTHIVTTYDEFTHHELDNRSFITSGKEFFGEEFDRTLSRSFQVSLSDPDLTEPVWIRTSAVGRSNSVATGMDVRANGNLIINHFFNPVGTNYFDPYTSAPNPKTATITPSASSFSLSFDFSKNGNSDAKAWLDFYEINYRRFLRFSGASFTFRDKKSLGVGNIARFDIDNAGNSLIIWDVTNPVVPIQQISNQNGSIQSFTAATDTLREYCIFREVVSGFPAPVWAASISNQNLHATTQTDFVIVSYGNFMDEANRLAEFHRQHDGMTVLVVNPLHIYNEFSGGAQDITAIRDFVRMLYERASVPDQRPKYLLLFGDASYDYKNITKNNTNFVPTYQTYDSWDPSGSYASDDFFAFLDSTEGEWIVGVNDKMDIGVGRIPAPNIGICKQVVDKIIHYYDNTTLGDWRNTLCFVADDEDGNIHLNESNGCAVLVDTTYKQYNIDKIYFDAYKQQSVGNGFGYPDATNAVNSSVSKGALIMNYTGHGSETQLAHESVITLDRDIKKWKNYNTLPLFITATCEFSRFDDPARISAGEEVLYNTEGGGIALLTTTRLVFSGANFTLNYSFYQDNSFAPLPNGTMPRLGDIVKKTKNSNGNNLLANTRNFSLLGDPAMMLAYPKYKIVTTKFNSVAVSGIPDTIKALDKITLEGEVKNDLNQILTNFNGEIVVTVYDKYVKQQTLANDPGSYKQDFMLQKNIIYKGKATVASGKFIISFVVPKDIAYNPGSGKISYYAFDKENNVDAAGYNTNVIVGGTSSKVTTDVKGPEVELYMNDTTFKFGGITDENPWMLGVLYDENGINTTGSGIGHEITAVLDGDEQNVMVLNDYYVARLNDYTRGDVRYPYKNLAEGKHTLKLKAWDVYNNSAQATTEFYVYKGGLLKIANLMNYPNPFAHFTTFSFEHNRAMQVLHVKAQIFDLTGQLMAELETPKSNGSARFDEMVWDGTNQNGVKLLSGMYVYRISVTDVGGQTATQTGKLILTE